MRYEGGEEVATFNGVEAVEQTERAVLVRFKDGKEEWIPQSRISDDSEIWKKGQAGKLVICRDAAERRGLA